MLDVEAALQQEALGIVGVNLLHGAFFEHHEPEKLVESLLDRLSTDRMEIDLIRFRGIEFRNVDNRLVALQLVQLGLSGVAMFGPDKEVLQPSEVLRKKAVLVERGSFRPTTRGQPRHAGVRRGRSSRPTPPCQGKTVLALAELTMRNLLAGGDERGPTGDFLARAELLAACGLTTMISDYFDYYRLAAFLSERTSERIGIVMGVPQPDRPVRRAELTPSCRAASSRASAGCSRTTSRSTSTRCGDRRATSSRRWTTCT